MAVVEKRSAKGLFCWQPRKIMTHVSIIWLCCCYCRLCCEGSRLNNAKGRWGGSTGLRYGDGRPFCTVLYGILWPTFSFAYKRDHHWNTNAGTNNHSWKNVTDLWMTICIRAVNNGTVFKIYQRLFFNLFWEDMKPHSNRYGYALCDWFLMQVGKSYKKPTELKFFLEGRIFK